MNFLDALTNTNNETLTDNGAPAYKSTLNGNLDFFGLASRTNVDETVRKFRVAFFENPETAMRTLFYFRDIRGGQGERKFVHECLKTLVDDPRIEDVIKLIPEYGYWKDLMIFHNTAAWKFVVNLINDVLRKDLENMLAGKSVTLLAKWMPSANAGKASHLIATDLAAQLGYTGREYRKVLSKLRNYIKIVETKMCSNEWGSIDYATVPSKANLMYAKAFKKHDFDRYNNYIKTVNSGEAKINAATLNPCEIFSNVRSRVNVPTMEALWKSLPDYMETPYNGLVIADTSGSMQSPMIGKFTPFDVAMSLAVYIAERNPSTYWRNKFLIFSGNPELLELRGNTIGHYVKCFPNIVSNNTDLIKVAKLIVDAGVRHSINNEDMPKVLTIISDMQFDSFDEINGNGVTGKNFILSWSTEFSDYNRPRSNGGATTHHAFSSIFTNAGYSVPNIIYWNVNNTKNSPVKFDDYGTALVSGYSPSVLKSILSAKSVTPVDIMVETVYNKRYDPIGHLFK